MAWPGLDSSENRARHSKTEISRTRLVRAYPLGGTPRAEPLPDLSQMAAPRSGHTTDTTVTADLDVWSWGGRRRRWCGTRLRCGPRAHNGHIRRRDLRTAGLRFRADYFRSARSAAGSGTMADRTLGRSEPSLASRARRFLGGLERGPPVGPVMQPAPDCSTGHWPVEHSTKPQKGDQASRGLRNERSLVLGPFGVWSSWRGAWTFDLARHLSGRRDRLANQPYYDHGSVYWNVALIVGLLDSVLRQSRCGPAQLGRRPPHYSAREGPSKR